MTWEKRLLLVVAFVVANIVTAPLAMAQLGGLDPDQIEAFTRRVEGAESNRSDRQADTQDVQSYQGREIPELPSRLEILYSRKADNPLLQIGYDAFGKGNDVVVRKMGGLQDNYVIGIGDGISIDLRGQENQTYSLRVDDVGRILLPNLNPISAAGRRFGDFRSDLEGQIEDAYIATNVFVSIDEVRQVSVLMSGEINYPGPLTLSGLSTSIDAIALAGGIKKTGSLRNITVFRGDESLKIDLYSIILGTHVASEFSLMEGDRIHIPPVGQTVAISGWVKRPGIYELHQKTRSLTTRQMIDLAGGMEVRGEYGLSLLRITDQGGLEVVGVNAAETRMREGDLLLVEPNEARARGAVRVSGNVRRKGLYAQSEIKSVGNFLKGGSVLGASTYMPFALIARKDRLTQNRTYLPFSPLQIINGSVDVPLLEDDVVRFFSNEEATAIAELLLANSLEDTEQSASPTVPLQIPIQPVDASAMDMVAVNVNAVDIGAVDENVVELPQSDMGIGKLENLIFEKTQLEKDIEAERVANLIAMGGTLNTGLQSKTAEEILRTGLKEAGNEYAFNLLDPALLNLFQENRVSILGAVKVPGDYLFMPGISLGQALDIAGGLSIRADLSAVEITSTIFERHQGISRTERGVIELDDSTRKSVKLRSLDVVRVREVYSDRVAGNVTISGEVKYPGSFDLVRGERLSSVLQRAGGLTSSAYPYGAVFTRESAATAEKKARDALLGKMEGHLSTIVAGGNLDADGATMLAQMIERMKSAPAAGRVSIEADPAVLIGDGQKDLILEPGDTLIIPPRPNSITVVGEVLSPSSYQFNPKFDAGDYIDIAGGYGRFADKRRAFLIMPDGRAQRLGEGRWQFGTKMIAPGTIIVVPRNLSPFQWGEFLTSMTQISSQLALTAASISVVARNSD